MDPLPVIEPGQTHTLSITDIAFGGEGVGRIDEMVVFVPFVIKDEQVEVEILEVKKKFARAKLLRVLQPSPLRTDPPCPYFGDCGGCQYQHIQYEEQLRIKHKQVADLMERLGGFSPDLVHPVLPCPQPYGYRNRLMVRSQWNKLIQKLHIGFLRAQDRLVVDVEECKIAEPALNEEIRQVRKNPPPRGGLKVVVRIAPDGWEVPQDSFFQNNFFMLPALIQVVRNSLQEGGCAHLVDAYCGVGFFALELADLVKSFVGVEIDRPGMKAAQINASNRGIVNGDFLLGATEELLPGLLKGFKREKTCVILDPPRRGCAPNAIEQLRELRPAQIIHISCHPATLARDLKLLCAEGIFSLKSLVPVDMFPQTQHVECVADLRCTYPEETGASE